MLGANARLRKIQKLLYPASIYIRLRETESHNRKWNIFWADNTRSQNKNHTVVFYFDYLAASGFRERIDYKFLEAGHSFGAVDRDGGLAEGLFRNAEHPGGVLRTSSDGDDRRIFLGLKFSIPGFFWV